jgi:hypothetical protein
MELHDEAAALEDLEVEVLDGGGGIFSAVEFNVAEAGSKMLDEVGFGKEKHYRKGDDIPSAHATVILDNPGRLDVSEAREDCLELLRLDLVVEITNVEERIRGGFTAET